MNIGKLIRMNRLFAHPSGNLCSVAVDHFIGYGHGLPAGCAASGRRSPRWLPPGRMR